MRPVRGGPAALAWAVKGCIAWQANGLTSCTAVDKATVDYRAEMDTLQRFFEDCCVLEPRAKANFGTLYVQYMVWCEDPRIVPADAMHAACQSRFASIPPLDSWLDHPAATLRLS